MKDVRLLANTVVGLGFSRRGLEAALEHRPTMIGCDAGSADFGPFYLGCGRDPKARLAVERDLGLMLEAALRADVPLVVGSCGGAGGGPHLDGYLDIVRRLADERGLSFSLAAISAEQPRELVRAKLCEGKVHPIGPVPELSRDELDETIAIVGMMGIAPVMEALDNGAQVVLAGRIADPAIFAGAALRAGADPALAWHAAKSIDKGALATTDPSLGSPVLATVTGDGFVVEPARTDVACTVRTVGAMTMHENPDPFRIVQPGGVMELSDARYEQLDARRVAVSGSRFESLSPATIKLEGAALEGYRTILLAGLRDPRLIARLDEFLERYRELLARIAASMGVGESQFQLNFRCYGRDAVLGEREHRSAPPPREVGLVVDVVAETEEISRALGSRLGPTGSRLDVFGRLGGGGNFAYPFSPSVVHVGPVYRWSVWHSMEITEQEETTLFPIHYEEVGRA